MHHVMHHVMHYVIQVLPERAVALHAELAAAAAELCAAVRADLPTAVGWKVRPTTNDASSNDTSSNTTSSTTAFDVLASTSANAHGKATPPTSYNTVVQTHETKHYSH